MSSDPTVYVVDNDRHVLRSMRWLIESAKLRVKTFDSPSEFLSNCDGPGPACAVVDVQMPEMSGLEVQRQLGEKGCKMPVIVMTGHGDVAVCTRSFRQGAFDFIEKPADDGFLLSRIEEAISLDRHRLEQAGRQEELSQRAADLTPREREVMELIASGRSLKQIAAALSISIQTAAKHRSRVFTKLDVENDVQLVRLAEMLVA